MFTENKIVHLQEPRHLCLVWSVPNAQRYIVGQLARGENESVSLKYFPKMQSYKEARKKKFVPIDAFPDEKVTYSVGVMDYFMSRVTRRTRNDFGIYLKSLGLDPADQSNISDFALLGYGEGRLPSDGYQVINDYAEASPPLEFSTEIAGLSYGDYSQRLDEVVLGQDVSLVREPDNPADDNAVQLMLSDRKLGYVNRVQAPSVTKWIREGFDVRGTIFRRNGLPTAPRIFLFLEISDPVEPQEHNQKLSMAG